MWFIVDSLQISFHEDFMKTDWKQVPMNVTTNILSFLAYCNWVFLSPVHNALKLSQVFGQISANSSKITLPTGKKKKALFNRSNT